MAAIKPLYRRVLIKISGEAFMGEQLYGIEKTACDYIAGSIKEIHDLNIQIGVVVGGGNIFRGNQAKSFGFARTPADHIGMLATITNGIVLQQCLHNCGVESHIMSAINCDRIVENYNWQHALQILKNQRVVIFVGGTGNPHFTTDTAAALRASEMQAEILLKATKVDGVFSDDPMKNRKAVKFSKLTYADALTKNLKVMDATAFALCQENDIPIYVFNLFKKGSLLEAVLKQKQGSLVSGG